jgi:hypothetical protein
MFYRSVNLDKEAEDSIQKLNAIYTKVEEIIATLPESRAALFAQTNLDQSYMWAVKSVEDAMLLRMAQKTKAAPAAPLEQPKAPMATTPPPVVPAPVAPVMPVIPVAPPTPAPVMPVIPVPPPTTDAEVLAQSRVQLDSLMSGIKELTDTVKVTGFPIK